MLAERIVTALLESDESEDPKDFIFSRTQPKKVHIVGRRWWRPRFGGTYHVADVYVDDQLVGTTPMMGGYDEAYLESGVKFLEYEGYIPDRNANPNARGRTPPRSWLHELGIPLTYEVYDVKRQRDL